MLRRYTAFAATSIVCVLTAPTGASEQQSVAAAANRANKTGPTVSQIRAAPIEFRNDRSKADAGKKPGPITQLDGGGHRYVLPDQTLVVFTRCGPDLRCDEAVFIARVGPGNTNQIAAVDEYVGACSMLTIGGRDELQAVSIPAFPGEIVVMQRHDLHDGTAARSVHDRHAQFANCLADAKKEFSAGRLNTPVSSSITRAPKPDDGPGVYECGERPDTKQPLAVIRFIPTDRRFQKGNITNFRDRLFAWIDQCQADRYQTGDIKRNKNCSFNGTQVTATEKISFQGQQAQIVQKFDAAKLVYSQDSSSGLAPSFQLSCRRKVS